MGKKIEAALASYTISLISNNGLWPFILLFVVLAIICVIGGWFLNSYFKMSNLKEQTEKIITEREFKAIECIEKNVGLKEKIQSYGRKVRETKEILSLSMRSFISVIQPKTPNSQVDDEREQLISNFFDGYLPAFLEYIDIKSTIISDSEKLALIETEIFPFLEMLAQFFGTVNMEGVLSKLNKSQAKILKVTLNPLLDILEQNISSEDQDLIDKKNAILSEITTYFD